MNPEPISSQVQREVLAVIATVPYDCPRVIDDAGRFELIDLVAMTDRAWVYRGRDLRLSNERFEARVAVKISRVQLASQEATLARSVEHPAAVRVIDRGHTADGLTFVVMEWIDGVPLDQQPLPMGKVQAWGLAIAIAGALERAHESGVVHCDIKPQNVLVDRAGRPFVMDFDLAIQVKSEECHRRGSIAYMAPEQFRGDAVALGPRVDVYGLAALLCHVVTGQPPHGFDRATIEESLRAGRSAALAGVQGRERLVLTRALHPEHKRRYATVRDFREDLEALSLNEPIGWIDDGIGRRLMRWAKRRPGESVALVAALLFSVGGVIAAWQWHVRSEQHRSDALQASSTAIQAGVDEQQRREREVILEASRRLLARDEQAGSGRDMVRNNLLAVGTQTLALQPDVNAPKAQPTLQMLTAALDQRRDRDGEMPLEEIHARVLFAAILIERGQRDHARDQLDLIAKDQERAPIQPLDRDWSVESAQLLWEMADPNAGQHGIGDFEARAKAALANMADSPLEMWLKGRLRNRLKELERLR